MVLFGKAQSNMLEVGEKQQEKHCYEILSIWSREADEEIAADCQRDDWNYYRHMTGKEIRKIRLEASVKAKLGLKER